MKTKALLHLDRDDPEALRTALSNLENLLERIPAAETELHVVANGSAVKLFRRECAGAAGGRIEALAGQGVHFQMCNNSLTRLGIDRGELLAPCEVVPAGIVEIVRLQAEGCAYVKP